MGSEEEYIPESEEVSSETSSDSEEEIQINKKQKLDKNSILFIINDSLTKNEPEPKNSNINNHIYKTYKKDIDLIDSINKKEYNLYEKVLKSNLDITIKAKLFEKLDDSSSYDSKNITWVTQVLKLPIGIYKNIFNPKEHTINNFLLKSRKLLDHHVYGMENVKQELLDFVVNCIHKNLNKEPISGTVLALKGERGLGKTKIGRALSSIFNLPFEQMSFGGMSDQAVLLGHDSTYVGSKCGRIAATLQKTKCMNPVILLDEIDKISEYNSAGVEGVFTHLLDETQNNEFNDLYFDGIPLDLSQILFIVTFNKIEKIDPIVLNRMKVIEIKEPSLNDKIEIVKKFTLPKVNYNNLYISDETLKYIIREKTKQEPGLRLVNKNIETLINRLNTILVLNDCKNSKEISRKFSYENKLGLLKMNENSDYIIDNSVVNVVLTENKKVEPWMNMYV